PSRCSRWSCSSSAWIEPRGGREVRQCEGKRAGAEPALFLARFCRPGGVRRPGLWINLDLVDSNVLRLVVRTPEGPNPHQPSGPGWECMTARGSGIAGHCQHVQPSPEQAVPDLNPIILKSVSCARVEIDPGERLVGSEVELDPLRKDAIG